MAAKAELPVSAKDLIRFTPGVYESEAEKPVYLIAVPSYATQARWERDVTACGATGVPSERVRAFLRDAVNALLEGEARSAALADLDTLAEFEARRVAASSNGHSALSTEELAETPGLIERVGELGQWAERTWPPYSELSAQQDYRVKMARLLAAKHFLRGWDGVTESCVACSGSGKRAPAPKPADAPAEAAAAAEPEAEAELPEPCGRCGGRGAVPLKFVRDRDGLLAEDVFEKLPRGDVLEIGSKALSQFRLDDERRKN